VSPARNPRRTDTLTVTCTRRPRAYVPDDGDAGVGDADRWNLHDWVDLKVVDPIPAHDGLPLIVDGGCGRTFRIPDEPWRWDVNTELRNGVEHVVERHLAVMCPYCGVGADRFSKAVDAYPFEYQGVDLQDLDRRERQILSNPELQDLLSDVADDERRQRLARVLINGLRGGAGGGYSHVTEGAVALAAATAKSIIGLKAGSAVGLLDSGMTIGFDGVTNAAVPVLLERCYCTFGANSPGTNSTGTTERQEYGRVITADWTGGRNWTTEPTTLTVYQEGLLHPQGGVIWYDEPLGSEPDSAVSEGFVLRCNAPAVVNVRATQRTRHG
jgi:hypothetical protein